MIDLSFDDIKNVITKLFPKRQFYPYFLLKSSRAHLKKKFKQCDKVKIILTSSKQPKLKEENIKVPKYQTPQELTAF